LAAAKKAELLAKHYRTAEQAMEVSDWPGALEALTEIARADETYRDIQQLMKKATAGLESAQVELRLSASVKPSPVPPNSSAHWTVTVRNPSTITVRDIVATADEAGQIEDAFDLRPGESHKISFSTYHTTRGARRRITVNGRKPNGDEVVAQVKASVRVETPLEPEPAPPETSFPSVTPVLTQPLAHFPPASKPVNRSAPWPDGFLPALRRAKETVDLRDRETNRMIDLLEESERHYRIATGQHATPPAWDREVEAWEEAVAGLRLTEITFVSLSGPTAEAIREHAQRLAKEISRRLRFEIPV
jgi:hypothetical protein